MATTLIDQGTYGCIYRPGLTCDLKPQSEKFTTKIHAKGEYVSENEAHIGEMIRTKIPRFHNYFSPVLETCDVNLAKVNKDDIDQCEFIDKDIMSRKPLTYKSSKLKYIEGTTLDKYIKEHPSKQVRDHLHKALSISVKKLAAIGIVHFDIKENNVIVKPNGMPILIDFGISIDMNNPDKPMNQLFYTYAPKYDPWCLEIHIISYYVKHPNVKKVTKAKIMEIANESNEQNLVKAEQIANKYDGEQTKTIIRDLLKTYDTWDQYAVDTMMNKYNIST